MYSDNKPARLPSPEELEIALRSAGFELVGQRTGHYTRWSWPLGSIADGWKLLVPAVADDGPEYAELVDAVLFALSNAVQCGEIAGRALAALAIEGGGEALSRRSDPADVARLVGGVDPCDAISALRNIPCDQKAGHPPLWAHDKWWDHGNVERDAWWTGDAPRAGITDQLILSDADYDAVLAAGEITEDAK